jgi:formylglycine-generating enzyme required for sulfatase activity
MRMSIRHSMFILCLAACWHLLGCAGATVKTPPPAGENPPPGVDADLWKTVDILVAKLGDDDYFAREAAQKEIETLPGAALEAVKAAVERRSKDKEIKWRGEKAMTALTNKVFLEKAPREFTNSIGMKLVLIPAGEFMMGSPETEKDRSPYESPQHKIKITKPFYMGTTEVTQAQWKALMGNNPSGFHGDDLPVENVTWNDCQEFLEKLSAKEWKTYRLPSEAEWEYGCRAGTTTPFNTGEAISTDQANYDGNYTYGNGEKGENRQKTTPAGSFKPNAWGVYDMHGNLWEWCQDWYEEDYYKSSPSVDPTGPAQGADRVLRGGGWISSPMGCRSAYRERRVQNYHHRFIGFRVVLMSGPMTPQ